MVNGLVEIHKNDMIHRDIKPENIFIDYSKQDSLPTAKIGDFGLAKVLKGADDMVTVDSVSTRTRSSIQYFSSVAGTQAYMAPEISKHLGSSTMPVEHQDAALN